MTNRKSSTRCAPSPPSPTYAPDRKLLDLTGMIADVMTDPRTPPAVRSAMQAAVVNVASNESGYEWAEDAEALRFLLPRFFYFMPEGYANGLLHALSEFAAAARREGGAR